MKDIIIGVLITTSTTVDSVVLYNEYYSDSPTNNCTLDYNNTIQHEDIRDIINIEIVEEPIEEVEWVQEENYEEEPIVLPYYEITAEISYYCGCSDCSSGTGIMANGEYVYEGAIASPYCFEFGTQIEFDGYTYEVCDRGSFIETYWSEEYGLVYRLDVFTWGHEFALEMGRYITTAKVYY